MQISSNKEQMTTNCSIVGQGFSIKASPVAVEILCSKLYTKPVLAIVRELLTNAYDSHKLAGKEDVPIYVHLPDYMDSNFVIRDYGVGLSKEDILDMYVSFFTSTKADTNDFTGCFGLGSKTPFAYTSTFSIVSYYNGVKYTFVATKKDGYPHIYPVKEELTEEANGLQISIPSISDTYEMRFEEELKKFIKYVPEIKLELNKNVTGIHTSTPLIVNDKLKLYINNDKYSWQKDSYIIVKQGQNTYKTENRTELVANIVLFNSSFDIVYEVPIGTLNIPPSRESLSVDSDNGSRLNDIIQEVEKDLKNYLDNNLVKLADISRTFKRTLVDYRNKLYFELYGNMWEEEYPFAYPRLCLNDEGNIAAWLRNTKNLMFSNKFIETDKEYIIITNCHGSSKVGKVKRVVNNELDNIGIIIPYIDTTDKKNYVQKVQELKNAIWLLNNNPSLTFNIAHMTLNQFLKKYPNSVKQKEYTVKAPTVRTKTYYIRYNMLEHYSIDHMDINGLQELQKIKNYLIPENTFIVYKDKEKMYHRIIGFLDNCMDLFTAKETNISNELSNILQRDIDRTINILIVASSSRKHFKEYKELNIDLLRYCCCNVAKHLTLNDDKVGRTQRIKDIHKLKSFIEGIDVKAREVIQRSTAYKVLAAIADNTKYNTNVKYIGTNKEYKALIDVLPNYKQVFKQNVHGVYSSLLVKRLETIAKYSKRSNIIKNLLKLVVKRETNVLFLR